MSFPIPIQIAAGGTLSQLTLLNFEGSITVNDAVPVNATLNGGNATMTATAAPSILISGSLSPEASIVLIATAATEVTLPSLNNGGLLLIAGALTSFQVPAGVASVTLSCTNLTNLTLAGLSSCTSFACPSGKLTQASVDGVLTALDAQGSFDGSVNLSGGTNASPTINIAAAAGTFQLYAGALPSGGAYFTCPPLTSGGTLELFWISVDGGGSAPGITSPEWAINLWSGMSSEELATAIADAISGNSGNYSATPSGTSVIATARSTGERQAVTVSGMTLEAEQPGATAQNSAIASLLSRGWSVSTN